MNAPVCKCGAVKVPVGRTKKFFCPPCNRAYIRRRTGTGQPTNPVKVVGARDRLAHYLDTHWNEALPKLADLLERTAAFGVTLEDRTT